LNPPSAFLAQVVIAHLILARVDHPFDGLPQLDELPHRQVTFKHRLLPGHPEAPQRLNEGQRCAATRNSSKTSSRFLLALNQLQDLVGDTSMQVGSEAYAALAVYTYAKAI